MLRKGKGQVVMNRWASEENLGMTTLAHFPGSPSMFAMLCKRHSKRYQRAYCQLPAVTVAQNSAGRIHIYGESSQVLLPPPVSNQTWRAVSQPMNRSDEVQTRQSPEDATSRKCQILKWHGEKLQIVVVKAGVRVSGCIQEQSLQKLRETWYGESRPTEGTQTRATGPGNNRTASELPGF